MSVRDLEERAKQGRSTQDTAMKRIHTTEVVSQEATATIVVEGIVTHHEATVIHVAEETTAMAEAEVTIIATTIGTTIATQVATQRHQPEREDEVTEAAQEATQEATAI